MNETIKSCFVAVVGRPNVGKSTLVNALVGEKVAIVTHKPQTTRNSIVAILNDDEYQIVFTDTPGIHKPKTKLGEIMVKSSKDASSDTDLVLLVVEPNAKITQTETELCERFKAQNQSVFLIINKIDTAKKEDILKTISEYSALFDFEEIIPISSLKKDGTDILLSEIKKKSLEGPLYFPKDMTTDQPIKQLLAEIIREKALKSLENEIPHGLFVEIESIDERDKDDLIQISAVIYCEKQTHKAIVIGKNGAMLKTISSRSREDMEEYFGRKVFLRCFVKVKEDWRNKGAFLRNFGLEN